MPPADTQAMSGISLIEIVPKTVASGAMPVSFSMALAGTVRQSWRPDNITPGANSRPIARVEPSTGNSWTTGVGLSASNKLACLRLRTIIDQPWKIVACAGRMGEDHQRRTSLQTHHFKFASITTRQWPCPTTVNELPCGGISQNGDGRARVAKADKVKKPGRRRMCSVPVRFRRPFLLPEKPFHLKLLHLQSNYIA